MLIAQITDAHVAAGPGDGAAAAALEGAVAAIGALDPAPEAVLFTGDLAASGRPAEYERVRELIAPLAMPVHPLMGNHDDREALQAAFADHPGVASGNGSVQYSARIGPVTLIACDSSKPGDFAGRLGADRLDWIANELERAAGTPTILAIHHPPIDTGLHEFDVEIPLAASDRAALAAIPHQPDLIVAGHIHLPVHGTLGATPVLVCPSVHLQAAFDLRPGANVQLIPDPPGFAVHLHGLGPGFVSHVRPITPSGRVD